jgi:hypothetical protein
MAPDVITVRAHPAGTCKLDTVVYGFALDPAELLGG